MNSNTKKISVLIIDIQPIDPPVGGGRIRLLGLYHNLGDTISATYLGSFDWEGEKFRKHRLSKGLIEIDIPLSSEQFSKCRELQTKVNGKTIIDVTFPKLGNLSEKFINEAQKLLRRTDIIIFSHPWVFPLLKDNLKRDKQLIIYDAQNMEGFLRAKLFEDNDLETEIVRDVIRAEFAICHFSDLILTCSHEDRVLFHKIYDVPYSKMKLFPNGVFINKTISSSSKKKSMIRDKLGFTMNDTIGLFLASDYPPNIEAANYIVNSLAQNIPEMKFVIAGGVGDKITNKSIGKDSNIVITGFIDDEMKQLYLTAADIALNPMFSGSGTNIKMFEYMSAGLPIITTDIGARGIETNSRRSFISSETHNLVSSIKLLNKNSDLRKSIARVARQVVEEKYSWKRISSILGSVIYRYQSKIANKACFFSVIIPTYERHDQLDKLIMKLSKQVAKDFEIIIIDQSSSFWTGIDMPNNLDLYYFKTDIKGATIARNIGSLFARGRVLAFTDDDCEPDSNWLYNALKYFNNPNVIGLEGLIKSSKLNDQRYRTVSNEGFAGLGFMTANLFIRSDIFNRINGFDESFDNPHFREDTDMAWRALEHGEIPYAGDVIVFHPPHKRKISRESRTVRAGFFEKDALLLKKHPDRYKNLFLKENHWKNTPGFWPNLLIGLEKYSVTLPDFYKSYMQ